MRAARPRTKWTGPRGMIVRSTSRCRWTTLISYMMRLAARDSGRCATGQSTSTGTAEAHRLSFSQWGAKGPAARPVGCCCSWLSSIRAWRSHWSIDTTARAYQPVPISARIPSAGCRRNRHWPTRRCSCARWTWSTTLLGLVGSASVARTVASWPPGFASNTRTQPHLLACLTRALLVALHLPRSFNHNKASYKNNSNKNSTVVQFHSRMVKLRGRHLVYAAVASSAPVSAIVDFEGYDPIVAHALAYPLVGGSAACRDAVAAVSTRLDVCCAVSRHRYCCFRRV
eukprot:SAG31_NODE_1625_length_7716_cov_23.849941_4_plen_285_part_00